MSNGLLRIVLSVKEKQIMTNIRQYIKATALKVTKQIINFAFALKYYSLCEFSLIMFKNELKCAIRKYSKAVLFGLF